MGGAHRNKCEAIRTTKQPATLADDTIASDPRQATKENYAKLAPRRITEPDYPSQSVDILKETDLVRTLFTLKRNEEQILASSDDHGNFVLGEASKLSADLLEEERSEIVDHKDPSFTLKTKGSRIAQKK
jgi:hypothetical protein